MADKPEDAKKIEPPPKPTEAKATREEFDAFLKRLEEKSAEKKE